MKLYFINIILFFISINCYAQKDKTLTWSAMQKGKAKIFISQQSHPYKEIFYEEYYINPKEAKVLHLDISGALKSNYSKSDTFSIQVRTRTSLLLNDFVEGSAIFNLKLQNTDSLGIFIFSKPTLNEPKEISINYLIADTAELIYKNIEPQLVFEKMLELARTRFTNKCSKLPYGERIKYKEGLFSNNRHATRSSDDGEVTQYVNKLNCNNNEAEALFYEWGQTLKNWMKDYNITSIIKTEPKKDFGITKQTEFVKMNEKGLSVFKVILIKEEIMEFGASERHYNVLIKITDH